MLKYLRIAVTAFSLTACVLLIALWVLGHQFWYHACWSISDAQHLAVESDVRFCISWRFKANSCPGTINFRSLKIYPVDVEAQRRNYEQSKKTLGTIFKASNTIIAVTVPHWVVGLMFFTIAIVPWVRWKYSLRTLLIATTLVAVALGGIVVVSR